MKSLKAILGIALATAGIGGAVAVGATTISGAENNHVQMAEAAGETTLYINQFDEGGTWNNFSYYLFHSTSGAKNAEWPGLNFTDSMKTSTPNEYDQYQYVLTIPTTYDTLILVGNPDNWGGSQAQTEDLTISSMENNGLYCGSQIPNTNKFNVGYYPYSTKTVYLLDLKGDVYNTKHYCHTFASGKNGTTWPGVEMTKVAGSKNLYSVDINNALDNVIFNNNGSNQTNTIPNVADGNSYVVYPDNGYNLTTLDAATFIDSYMKFETVWLDKEGTGLCKSAGWYSSARSAFTGKTAAQKSKILEHEPTKYRFQNWATANGETLNTTNGTISSRIIFETLKEDKGNILITAICVGVIFLGAVAGYFLLRKKKFN